LCDLFGTRLDQSAGGTAFEGELRELIISYGHSGYVALYRFVVSRDEVRILTIRHQREVGFLP
jgi:hypothetical protein